MELQEKVETNTWDSIDDFMGVMNEARAGNWHWFKNTKCKYVELRVDMRDGGCIIKDREGKRIDPKDLAFQYGERETPNAELCGSPKRSVGESERAPG